MAPRPALLLLAVALSAFASAPVQGTPAVTWSCDDVALAPAGEAAYDNSCPAGGAIRPGVRSGGCTLSWVLTDGTDLYITTAGHCGGVGTAFSVAGVGTIGSVVYQEANFDFTNLRDWAFIRIDPAVASFVDPTMVHYGGPFGAGALAGLDPVRPPVPGDGVLHYGHGYGMGQEDGTKARAGVVAAVLPTAFAYPGEVGGGDSGSPVRFATGEAAGIAVAGGGLVSGDNRDVVPAYCAPAPPTCAAASDACGRTDGACDGVLRPDGIYGAVIATRLDVAIQAFEGWLGKDVRVVEGDLPEVGLA
jgi:hypothetical protein